MSNIWICNRHQNCDKGCGAERYTCSFELRGPKAGTTCPKKLCRKCAVMLDDKPYCAPHARLRQKEEKA